MYKEGSYAIYQGKEYRMIKKKSGEIVLLSYDKSDLDKGFEYDGISKHKYSFGLPKYKKSIEKDKLEHVYNIVSFAIYKGYKFFILTRKDNKILLYTPDSINVPWRELGFTNTERYVYQKWINKREATRIFEEKKPIKI